MGTFHANYESPHNANPQSGRFTFESAHPLNSRANEQDARYKMLELFGNEAVAWRITKITRAHGEAADELVQPGLDFREPKKTRKRRQVERGTL